MRVLAFITHPPFQFTLAKSGHDFTVVSSEFYAEWPVQQRPLPANLTIARNCPDPADFDVVIVSTPAQYSRIAGRIDPRRIIFLSHTALHPCDSSFFAHLPGEVALVHISDYNRATFGELARRGHTIRLAVDTEVFCGYQGETVAILTVADCSAVQQDCGYALFERLTNGLSSQVIGHGNENIHGTYPTSTFEHLLSVYCHHRCFLNTDPHARLHLSTLEAMATGLPLVTVPIADLEAYLEHGVNAFVSADEDELRSALETLLTDTSLARRVGAAGRGVVQQHFGLEQFSGQWNELFDDRIRGATRSIARSVSCSGDPPIAINAMSVGGEMTGIGHHVRTLINALATTDAEQQYLVLTNNPQILPEDRRFQHCSIDRAEPLWEQLHLPQLLTDKNVALYHNPAFGLPVVKSSRYVATVHDCIPRLFPEYAPPWLQDFFQHWAPTWLRFADHIICISEHTKHDIMHLYGVDPDRVTVVYQCAAEVYQPIIDQARLDAVRSRYGLDRPYVLSVGRVELRKNVAGLLQAFEILQASYDDDLLLVFAGPRDENASDPCGELPLPGRHGNTIVTGYVPSEDIAALYSGCAVFCFPSFYEGFGIPVLEAMQCGAPVVTSRVSSLPEVGGDAPLYVDPYDAEHIAYALGQVIEDETLRRTMSRKGLMRAAEFSLQRFGADTAEAYRRTFAS